MRGNREVEREEEKKKVERRRKREVEREGEKREVDKEEGG